MVLANSLQNVSKLRKLTLNSNPDIGDAGMVLLNGVVQQSKIDILDISDCGITIAIVDQVLQWTNHLKQLDATKNPKFVMKEGDFQHSFTCLMKLDDGTHASNSSKNNITDSQSNIRSTFGLSFQPMDTLPDTPF
ncbi:hypothetical protein PS6_006549 [Mucor atramentarius]